jgi:hypothetical protein
MLILETDYGGATENEHRQHFFLEPADPPPSLPIAQGGDTKALLISIG